MGESKVLVPVADGSEEMETLGIVATLRAAGFHVTVASVSLNLKIQGSRGIHFMADTLIKDCTNETYCCIVLPGGMPGATHLAQSKELEKMLKDQKAANRWIAAICASPAVVLEHHGLLNGETAVAYPAMMSKIKSPGVGRVNVSNKIVTSVGPSSVLEMSVKLVELLESKNAADRVKETLLVEPTKA